MYGRYYSSFTLRHKFKKKKLFRISCHYSIFSIFTMSFLQGSCLLFSSRVNHSVGHLLLPLVALHDEELCHISLSHCKLIPGWYQWLFSSYFNYYLARQYVRTFRGTFLGFTPTSLNSLVILLLGELCLGGIGVLSFPLKLLSWDGGVGLSVFLLRRW
jgi:hypothetical protein